jgi:uncharacterized membrane protein YccC
MDDGEASGGQLQAGPGGAAVLLRQSLRLLAACLVSYAVARAIGLHETYWALITAVVVMQPGFADTLAASRNRVVGTIIGAMAGLMVLEAARHGWPSFWLFWCALVPLAVLTAARPSLRLCCVTLIVVVLLPGNGAPFLRAFDRIFAILIGSLASIVVSVVFWRGAAGKE